MSFKKEIISELKKEILSLELKPGTIISETNLSEKYQISRTPIRDILKQLALEGYIDIFPKKGSIISYIDLNSVEQIVYLRMTLEKEILKDLSGNVTLKGLHELKVNLTLQKECLNNEDGMEKFLQLDDDFHKTLYDLAGRLFLWNLIQQFKVHYIRYRKLHMLKLDKLIELQKEHELLVTYIVQGEKEKIEQLLYRHLHEDITSLFLPKHFAEYIKTN